MVIVEPCSVRKTMDPAEGQEGACIDVCRLLRIIIGGLGLLGRLSIFRALQM